MSKAEALFRKLTRRRYFALNFKLVVAIFIAAVIAAGAFFGLALLENHLAQKFYLSDSAQKRITDDAYRSLTAYVEENQVKASDTDKLNAWMKDRPYAQLIVYDNKHDVYSAGFVLDSRIVSFQDGSHYVYLKVGEENGWYNTMNILKVVIAALIFLFVIIVYNTLIIHRISLLSEDVQRISQGDLEREIHVGHADEIGILAVSVDAMRDTLNERMNNERQAWDANTQLITAMSHDIRTPLTSLIGYLDIIESGKFESEEERSRYIASSREKAFQLKELSDELFRYFLVFGREEAEREMEQVDGGILFQQLLVEHVAELISCQYQANLQYNVPEGVFVRADISSVRRLFDNLFSNIRKYADPRFSVEVKADLIQGRIKLILSNHIRTETKKVESTNIGVKTCQKIAGDMGAIFRAMEEEKIYTTEILVPVTQSE